MFATTTLAALIEDAQARLTRERALVALDEKQFDRVFVREIAGGVPAFIRCGSPMNKVIGVGMDGAVYEESWAEVEHLYRERNEPVRVELSTLCPTALGAHLTGRGYRLVGFENVLGARLEETSLAAPSGIRIERATSAELQEWSRVLISGFSSPDQTGVVVDNFTRETIERAIRDHLLISDFHRYLGIVDGVAAGAASLRINAQIAMFTGAATLAPYRRRGIQRALLARRLADAHASGAEIATVTTAGASRSQENAIHNGFSLLYSRAILERQWTDGAMGLPRSPS
jgi:N-acetylglutamate synthase-like GNAT family acetyltransferase